MIYFLTTSAHKYALRDLASVAGMPTFQTLSYNKLFKKTALDPGTYVFCDLDRLGFWMLELSAHLYRAMQQKGWPVYNDPGRFLDRYALLKTLHVKKLNQFNVWKPAYQEWPDRFPVFLRTCRAHRGVIGDLLVSMEDCQKALEAALAEGYALSDLIFVEYCAQPIAEGLYRKLSAFRIGEQVITGMSVHESNWQAKYGEDGIASAQHYEEEKQAVMDNRFGEAMRQRFECANIEFGRADFTFVDGAIQTYEINTNPYVSQILEHRFPIRVEADALYHEKLAVALKSLDQDLKDKASLGLDSEMFRDQRKRDRLVFAERWTP